MELTFPKRTSLAQAVNDARSWIYDCTDEVPAGIADATAIILTHRNFEGGWDGFIDSDGSLDPAEVFAQIIAEYGDQFAANIYPHGGPWPASLFDN
jgi:hypothetical protein